jgi:2-oxoglutarate dehydrogenase complex dihydrolipoamide succinyltransferase (E2) component
MMARIEVIMPQMGESITEGTIVKWHKKVGDQVKKDETLLEISTDKVDSEIPSPGTGVLAEIVIAEQQTVAVRTVIAYLESEAGQEQIVQSPQVAAPVPAAASEPDVAILPKIAHPEGRFYSPLVLSIARAEGLPLEELQRVPGSGEGGRVSKKDLLTYLKKRTKSAVPEPASGPAARQETAPVQPAEARETSPGSDVERIPMTAVGQKMAQHMVNSIQTSPHVAAVHEVDMTAVVRHRAEHAEAFERREGFKLTFMPYIVDAVVQAIKKYPMINSSVEGTTIIRKKSINVGIAVASDNGLIVPVVRYAGEQNITELARAVHDLAERTRTRKLMPEDVQGGTFTITNYGVFGTLIGTPIINQPQIAILGTGVIQKRVVAMHDAIAIRSMAFFTMSFDHRVVDGLLGGMFLDQVVKNLQGINPAMDI